MNNNENKKCANCGAPVTTEICPYCNNKTGLNTIDADMEYPVIECKEANINFLNFYFPLIFAISFGFFGFIFPIFFVVSFPEAALTVAVMCSIFAIIGVISFAIAIKTRIRYNMVKRKGKEIEATVYGYINDNTMINENPTQIVKLLIIGKDGPKFILYQLDDTKKPYKINSKIKLLVYKDIFLIKEDKKYYFEQ